MKEDNTYRIIGFKDGGKHLYGMHTDRARADVWAQEASESNPDMRVFLVWKGDSVAMFIGGGYVSRGEHLFKAYMKDWEEAHA